MRPNLWDIHDIQMFSEQVLTKDSFIAENFYVVWSLTLIKEENFPERSLLEVFTNSVINQIRCFVKLDIDDSFFAVL
jgi:hypothetical protein